MKFAIDDAIYAYNIQGNSEGPVIVLLHGFTGSVKTWQSFITDWQHKYLIVTVDLPGHGQTMTKTPRTIEACCADLHAIISYIGLRTFHLAGYSMGGRIALVYADLYPTHIASLILESASPGLKTEQERLERIHRDTHLAEKIVRDGVEPFVNYWESIPLFRTQQQLSTTEKQAIRVERLSQQAMGLHDSLLYMGTGRQPNMWPHLQNMQMPVLLMAGEVDKKFIAINQEMTKFLPKVTFRIVLDAGHAIHVEDSQVFGKIVNGFITS